MSCRSGFDVEPYPLAEISPTDSQQTSELIVTSTDSGSSSTRIHHGVSQLSPIADQSPGPHSSSKFEEVSSFLSQHFGFY